VTGIAASARCERCGDSLVCGGLTRVGARYLVVIHQCTTCNSRPNTPLPGTRTDGQPGRRLAKEG